MCDAEVTRPRTARERGRAEGLARRDFASTLRGRFACWLHVLVTWYRNGRAARRALARAPHRGQSSWFNPPFRDTFCALCTHGTALKR